MVQTLINYMRGISHTIKKEDVVTNIDYALTSLSSETLPLLDIMIKSSSLEPIKSSRYIKNMILTSGIKAKDSKEFFVKLKASVSNIVKSSKDIENLVMNDLNDIVTDKTATVKDAAILKLVNDMSIISLFTLDFIYYITVNGDASVSEFPKKKFEDIKTMMPSYATIVKSYSEKLPAKLKDISNLPSNLINVEMNKSSILEKLIGKNSRLVSLPQAEGFRYNPIYHIRMYLVDREIAKYETLREKKKLIELRLLDLKLKSKNEENPKIAKQIEFWEEKLAKTEYDIKEIED